ncbi:DUF4291 domain-containing protein [Streptomyces sp. ST2-7A]|uniref:DUF4291 domain-containing protein n=1 Tax=Streptomyces sp. ST2-7A TaxID=2907214 RepID=UPI001F2D95C6|nr:DUF4291 domain-containing protein [Streptomyces sp. ST2-7A]MCE7079896.1 DUF4291 domain-containing protein [Streptomyces sp. ST2-7A]
MNPNPDHAATSEPRYRIRAVHTDATVTVYQAYPPDIGLPAARDAAFPATWKRDRMTWIKPSFLWMMYRCGWGRKRDQGVVLAIEISRSGFEWALRHACLSHHIPGLHGDRAAWREAVRTSPVRVQWDPERDLDLRPLPHRSLQVGLGPEAARRYADEWIVGIRDVTPPAREIHDLMRAGRREEAAALLPEERPLPLPDDAVARIVPPVGRPAHA